MRPPRVLAALAERMLVASAVWKVTWFSRWVSTSWASAIGPVTSMRGSFGRTPGPWGMASTSPVKRRQAKASTT